MGGVRNWKGICLRPRSSVKNAHVSSLRSWRFFKANSCASAFLALPLGFWLLRVEPPPARVANRLCSLWATSSSDCSGNRPRNVRQQSGPTGW